MDDHVVTQREIDEQSCRRILYHRVANMLPGFDSSDIARFELEDGTALFVAKQTAFPLGFIDIVPRNWPLVSTSWKVLDWLKGPPDVHIRIVAPWLYVAYRDGLIIDEDCCKRAIIEQLILEELKREEEALCTSISPASRPASTACARERTSSSSNEPDLCFGAASVDGWIDG